MSNCKYIKQQKYVSYDSGVTWSPLNEYRRGDLYEEQSIDCGYEVLYKWEVVSGYTCSGCTKFEKTQKFVSYDGGTNWEAVTPAEYGIGNIIEQGSADCGCSAQYRWVVVSGEYICIGTTKYNKEKKQVSYDGQTWSDVVPLETRANGIIEEQSRDCGYVEPIYRWVDGEMCDGCVAYKVSSLTSGGTTINVECNSSSTLVSSEVTNREVLSSTCVGNCVNIIGDGAFSGCTILSDARIPSTVASIGDRAFYNCPMLLDASIPDSVTSIGDCAFSGCTSLNRINLPNHLTHLGEEAFAYAKNFSSINIPLTLTSIPINCFRECDGLYNANIPNSVISIGDFAFYQCSSLTNINNGSGIRSIGFGAFRDCSGLTSVDLPSIITIDEMAFYYCSGLTSVTLGSGVTSIGASVFYNCSGLTSVTVNAIVPPELGNRAFYNTNDCPIYVPSQSVNSYKSASGWWDYRSRIQAIIT